MMRHKDLSQPAGGPFLQEMLEYCQYTLEGTQFEGELYYMMEMGYLDNYVALHRKGVNKTGLHKPSYNLVIYHNKTPIYCACYELDSRFSLEMSEEEAERVEDYLANETIGIMATRGVLWFVANRYQLSTLYSILRRESDDKKFLPLN
jgi:hypothetical protein